jgi:uroporphyrinogen-III synthase
MNLPAEAIPLFAVVPLHWTAPDPANFDALLLTSANAPRIAGEQSRRLARLPVHAVGSATAEAALAAGMTVASVGTAGVEALLATLPSEVRLLHLCGEDRTNTPSMPRITHVPVYRSKAIAAPGELARAVEAVVLVHSVRAGRRFAELLPGKNRVRIAAISPAVAAACGSGWAAVEAAPEPTDAALLSLAVRLCQQPQPK